ncbi:MAG: tryptophan--tRNA ligase [Candidatus Moranbacteria bacterium]|nr:tryptophan--tRNA ligase [Candidatus Moranbacteria bacterium]
MKKVILTGDRPTGKLHLGHYIGSLKNRVRLQNTYDQFVMIADVQALTDNAENPEKVRDNILEVAMGYLMAGIDPKKTTIFVQSLVPQIAELTVFFLNLVTVARLQKNPTVKEEMKQKGFKNSVPAGFFMYPVSQAADILSMKADLVPAGADQVPMVEQANEIGQKFNRLYRPTFSKVGTLVGDVPRLPGTDGKNKMSKSLGNCVYLSDSPAEIKKKVMSMYTDPGHVRITDPGKVKGNIVFVYLDAFDPDKREVAKLKNQYQKGGLGDVELKKRLIRVLENLIGPMRKKREALLKDKKSLQKILRAGTEKARARAAETMKEVRKAMKIDYKI